MADALRTVAAVALLVLLAGCSDDPSPLDADTLPSDVSSSDTGTAGFPSVTNCGELTDRQSTISTDAWASGGFKYWVYHLDSGDHVTTSVLAFDDAASVDAAIAELDEAIAECAASSTGGEVTALTDLPEGVTGYESSQRFNDTTKEGTMVFAPAGDDRIVTVSASRTDGEQPTANVVDLLEEAQKKATELDDLPNKQDAVDG